MALRKNGNNLKRPTIFDSVGQSKNINLYCEISNLTNEASVETFFIARLLKDLGYEDNQILNKKSISEIKITLGKKKSNYKPDYVLTYKGIPKWILDAKSTTEELDVWAPKCSAYCLELNKKYSSNNPVQFFVLSNGIITKVYKWDIEQPQLELSFDDFNRGNPKFEQFRSLLSLSGIKDSIKISSITSHDFSLQKSSPEVAKRLFSSCHNTIWKSEGYGPTAAFMEFTKLMFVKLWADKRLRSDPEIEILLEKNTYNKIPKTSVTFSEHWIESQEGLTENPVNDILFKKLRESIEHDIFLRKKKRIFLKNEDIDLKPHTIKSVVQKLQHYDLFGVDEDLNGRLFETFLSATMRGRELGQYFTPRSVVKLMTRMANPRANRNKMDKILDACCGTGGFLIEALSEMRNKIRNNPSLTNVDKDELLEILSNDTIYGVDFGKNPPIARIARINMYLHGDGGSRIYYADSLDKTLKPVAGESEEILDNQNELRDLFDNLKFDIVLTNPPFSMTKGLKNETEAAILRQYDLAKVKEGTSKIRPSLRSNVMFIERYRDLLTPGGFLFTVIDETLLSSKDDEFAAVRDFIRKNFIIRGIVSLQGDAFRRSGSRVKTSILALERKKSTSEKQTDVFVAFSEYLGIDDLPPKTSEHKVIEIKQKANEEISRISGDFIKFMSGDRTVLTVPPERVEDRLDLKFVVPQQGRFIPLWEKEGHEIKKLAGVLTPVGELISPQEYPEREFTLIKVSYSGICEPVEKLKGKNVVPTQMRLLHSGDLIFSNIRATDGAVGILPPELDGALVSKSFTVLRGQNYSDTVYIWSLIRTHEIRADMMSTSSGTGRYTTDWDQAKEVQIPWLDDEKREEIANSVLSSWDYERKSKESYQRSIEELKKLHVESQESITRFNTYKPPT